MKKSVFLFILLCSTCLFAQDKNFLSEQSTSSVQNLEEPVEINSNSDINKEIETEDKLKTKASKRKEKKLN